MKPLRKHVALALDGGGLRGIMAARALAMVEGELDRPCAEVFELLVGTSSGSIISAAIAAGIPADEIHALFIESGRDIFRKTWRSYWPLAGYKYPGEPLAAVLRDALGERTMGDFWRGGRLDVVITVRDLVENRTRFVKSWKPEYRDWKAWYAVLCSSSAPTYFPVVDGRYVDGGVGSYTNPCYLAAFEGTRILGWDPGETTLLSLGTGREGEKLKPHEADHYNALEWIYPLIETFLAATSDEQVRVVQHLFPELDFRRFQVDLKPLIPMDDPGGIPELSQWGERLGRMILEDETDETVVREMGRPE
jgi:predicted acylesterase/phospholipase RssA